MPQNMDMTLKLQGQNNKNLEHLNFLKILKKKVILKFS